MGNKFKLDIVKKELSKLKQTLPRQIADESRSFFMKNWDKQGFDDSGVEKWKEVQRRIPGTNPYLYPRSRGLSRRTKPINFNTGRLQRSIRVTQVSFARSVIKTDTPYAKYVNDKRRFIGRSKNLDRRINKLIQSKLSTLFKS